jgi:hypothetical protein
LAAWPFLGMFCVDSGGPAPSLATARLTDIHLVIVDPAAARAGFSLSWSYPDSARPTSFEIFQSLRRDSLGGPVAVVSGDSLRASMPLADTTSPYTVFFAVRAVSVEPTGQKLYGDTLPVDSIEVSGPVSIGRPSSGDSLSDRLLISEVLAGSTTGVTLRQSLFEKRAGGWRVVIDTCLPRGDCATPLIGAARVNDTLVLQAVPPGGIVPALFCVQGTENFEGHRTGLTQSMGCVPMTRVGP